MWRFLTQWNNYEYHLLQAYQVLLRSLVLKILAIAELEVFILGSRTK
ncbi:hypothetical protein [Nostoc sp. DSM 114161]